MVKSSVPAAPVPTLEKLMVSRPPLDLEEVGIGQRAGVDDIGS